MKNFETAQILIEKLTAENESLKQKIAQLSECTIDIQVDSSHKMEQMERERNAAMQKFTERMRNEARNHREKSNG